MSNTRSYEERKDIPKEFTWAVEDLYESDAAWKADLEKIKSMLPQIESYQGTLSKSADTLLCFLKLQD